VAILSEFVTYTSQVHSGFQNSRLGQNSLIFSYSPSHELHMGFIHQVLLGSSVGWCGTYFSEAFSDCDVYVTIAS